MILTRQQFFSDKLMTKCLPDLSKKLLVSIDKNRIKHKYKICDHKSFDTRNVFVPNLFYLDN